MGADRQGVGRQRELNPAWRAAAWSGVAAAVGSAALEIALWGLFTDALPDALYRDTRFAAALLLGRDVLSEAAPDARVLAAATIVHFALSLAYAIALAALIRRLRTAAALTAGALFGLALYAINLYGFTALFPWFAADRDAITAAAHVAFGVVAALGYAALRRRGVRDGASP